MQFQQHLKKQAAFSYILLYISKKRNYKISLQFYQHLKLHNSLPQKYLFFVNFTKKQDYNSIKEVPLETLELRTTIIVSKKSTTCFNFYLAFKVLYFHLIQKYYIGQLYLELGLRCASRKFRLHAVASSYSSNNARQQED